MSRRASIEGPPSPDSEKPKKPEEPERKPHVGPGIRKRLLEEKEKEKEKKLKEEEDKTQAMESSPSAVPKQPSVLQRPIADHHSTVPVKPAMKRSGEVSIPPGPPSSHQDILRRHNEEFNRQQNKRTALASVTSRPGFYIAADSFHGNVIIPVLPVYEERVDAKDPLKQK